jgi:mono/diheme cytochrome c family protein
MARQRSVFLVFAILVSMAVILAACGPGSEAQGEAMLADGPQGPQPGEVPAEFRDLVNPLAGDPQAIAAGSEAYAALCSQCHGPVGAGDGPSATGMEPKPGDLTDANRMPDLSDGYLYWRISEGGAFEPFISLMPAWGTLLSEQEMWQLVSYLRTLTP